MLKTLLAAVCVAAITTVSAHAGVTIRIGGAGSDDSPDTKAMQVFKEKMEAELGSDVAIELFPGSHLGTVDEMVEQVKGGVLECMYESVGVLGSFHPAANVEGVAYIYRDEDHFFRIWRGPVGQEVLDSIAKDAGFRVVGPAYHGFRQFLVTKPADSLDDLQGRKIRAPGIPAYIESIRALGANPATVAFEEVYTAVQQGVVDGVEQPLFAIQDKRFYEVAKHLVMTNHMAETMGFMCNSDWYQGQDERVRGAINAAADASADWYKGYTTEAQAKVLDKLVAEGVVVHKPDLAPFMEKAKEAKYDPALEPIIAKFRAVQ
ncbi:TRAP transporter substrate-binding protein [Kaistia granuli]|jgi:tripartite ATP-independent transporter DctP family solute receptor|uniref:TRAP transporter substrate-binding protein n=1 Tax=Kaistia granuli TaxID=363259 RepID=UPI00038129AA|nr:TRAP transporter substrate-binding protein [Kaistia granuli]